MEAGVLTPPHSFREGEGLYLKRPQGQKTPLNGKQPVDEKV